MIDLTALLAEFRTRNIPLVIVTDPSLGTSATDTLVLNILGSFAEFEWEMIREPNAFQPERFRNPEQRQEVTNFQSR